MNKPFEIFLYVTVIAGILGAIGISIAIELDIWNECRAEHSFWYCWRVLS